MTTAAFPPVADLPDGDLLDLADQAASKPFLDRTPREKDAGREVEQRAADWPVHHPAAPDAPIPGRHWHGGCDPDLPRVRPDGRCLGCGEQACPTCGRQDCGDHVHSYDLRGTLDVWIRVRPDGTVVALEIDRTSFQDAPPGLSFARLDDQGPYGVEDLGHTLTQDEQAAAVDLVDARDRWALASITDADGNEFLTDRKEVAA